MRFGDLTGLEIKRLLPEAFAVLIPLGCTEQQGPHLSTDFDSWMISALCEGVAERLYSAHDKVIITMPALPFGPTPEHAGFGYGYVNLRQTTHEAVVDDILTSLAEQGASRLVIWRGCGQHDLARVIESFNATHTNSYAVQPAIDYNTISHSTFGRPVPGGHADSFATSIQLHLERSRVRESEIRRPRDEAIEIDWSAPLDFSRFSDTGVIGDPTQADAAVGKQIWEQCVEAGTQIVLGLH